MLPKTVQASQTFDLHQRDPNCTTFSDFRRHELGPHVDQPTVDLGIQCWLSMGAPNAVRITIEALD